jgi:surfeit locus 1 family protein
VVPTAFAVVIFAALVSLGTWQVERKAWKEQLIATLDRRLAAAPAPLPARPQWPALDPARDEFRRVALTAELLNDKEALVYTSGSSLRDDVSGPGYWVFTPARLADGSLVMIDRGFVPEGRQDPATRRAGQIAGRSDLVGVLRWPEVSGLFTPAANPSTNLWFARDPAGMATAKAIGPIAPFYVEQEGPVPAGGLPLPGRLRPNLPNNHLGYILTWYGLAVVLVGVFATWAVSHRRPARAPGNDGRAA